VRPAKVLATAIAVLVLVTACGSSGGGGSASSPSASSNGVAALSAQEILDKASAAAKAQKSVYVKGSGTSGADSVAVDLKLRNGGGAVGSITTGGATIQLISTGTTVYIKADKAFWTSFGNDAAAQVIGDRWVKAPATDASFKDLASMGDFTAAIESFLSPSGTLTKGSEKTIDGTAAVGVQSSNGTLWVATTGDPLPIKIESSGSGGLTFADWGAVVDVTAPADADTLDLAKLAG
jgi:hypothetical protein